MFLTKQLSALSAINASVGGIQPLPAGRLQADVISGAHLPVVSGDGFVGVYGPRMVHSSITRLRRPVVSNTRGYVVVRFENVKSFELLVQNGKRLETFGLIHLNLEPIFHLVLSIVLEILVHVV